MLRGPELKLLPGQQQRIHRGGRQGRGWQRDQVLGEGLRPQLLAPQPTQETEDQEGQLQGFRALLAKSPSLPPEQLQAVPPAILPHLDGTLSPWQYCDSSPVLQGKLWLFSCGQW